jgi:hypothetical protein
VRSVDRPRTTAPAREPGMTQANHAIAVVL